jgi:hypothetical protein
MRLELQFVFQTAQDGGVVFDDENSAHKNCVSNSQEITGFNRRWPLPAERSAQ